MVTVTGSMEAVTVTVATTSLSTFEDEVVVGSAVTVIVPGSMQVVTAAESAAAVTVTGLGFVTVTVVVVTSLKLLESVVVGFDPQDDETRSALAVTVTVIGLTEAVVVIL